MLTFGLSYSSVFFFSFLYPTPHVSFPRIRFRLGNFLFRHTNVMIMPFTFSTGFHSPVMRGSGCGLEGRFQSCLGIVSV